MKITISVMAHPKRQNEALTLYKKVSKYPFFTCSIIWDEQNNEWHTGKRALLAGCAAEGGDWHVVLQDDAIIPADFYDHLLAALAHAPERTLVSLYTGTVRPYRTRVANAVRNAGKASWLRSFTLHWGVGIAIPTIHIKPVLEFVADRKEPYDFRVGYFYQRNMMPVFYTNPSLVDHNDNLSSLIKNDYDPTPRVAHNFISGPVQWNKLFVAM